MSTRQEIRNCKRCGDFLSPKRIARCVPCSRLLRKESEASRQSAEKWLQRITKVLEILRW